MLETLGGRMRMLRQRARLGQEELAERARRYADNRSIKPETLSRIEHGKNMPAAWMVAALAQALDTTSDYLLGLTDNADMPTVPRYPVPAPDIAPLVARLNALSDAMRAEVAGVIDRLLVVVAGLRANEADEIQPATDRQRRWQWLFDRVSEQDQEEQIVVLEQILARSAKPAAGAAEPHPAPARKAG